MPWLFTDNKRPAASPAKIDTPGSINQTDISSPITATTNKKIKTSSDSVNAQTSHAKSIALPTKPVTVTHPPLPGSQPNNQIQLDFQQRLLDQSRMLQQQQALQAQQRAAAAQLMRQQQQQQQQQQQSNNNQRLPVVQSSTASNTMLMNAIPTSDPMPALQSSPRIGNATLNAAQQQMLLAQVQQQQQQKAQQAQKQNNNIQNPGQTITNLNNMSAQVGSLSQQQQLQLQIQQQLKQQLLLQQQQFQQQHQSLQQQPPQFQQQFQRIQSNQPQFQQQQQQQSLTQQHLQLQQQQQQQQPPQQQNRPPAVVLQNPVWNGILSWNGADAATRQPREHQCALTAHPVSTKSSLSPEQLENLYVPFFFFSLSLSLSLFLFYYLM